MSEPYVVTRGEAKRFSDTLHELVQACIDFKLGDPYSMPPEEAGTDALRDIAMISELGQPLERVLSEFTSVVLPRCLNFSSPTFLAHPDSGNAGAAIVGDVANAFLQQNLSSIDYSPAATAIEIQLLKELRTRIGYPSSARSEGALAAGGAFVFGGAGANFSCLLAAREQLKRRLAVEGRFLDPRRTRVLANRPFTHFSLRRSLSMLGLGNRDLDSRQRAELGVDEECLFDVDTDDFRLDPDDLERRIEKVLTRGEDIMCVFTVAGDSRFMAFDNLARITAVAERYGIWVHVDACEGGQVLFSPTRRNLMQGVERTHSISMDPHKVLLVPYNLSLFYLRDPEWLSLVTSDPAQVINQDDQSLGGFTPGVNSKSFISLKLLLFLKHWGWHRLAREIERRHELALEAAEWIEAHPQLCLINPAVQHNAVAFMYIPTHLHPERTLEDAEVLNTLNRAIHASLNTSSRFFVHAFPARDDTMRVRPDQGTVYPLRMMFGNPLTDWSMVRECLETIVKIGASLAEG